MSSSSASASQATAAPSGIKRKADEDVKADTNDTDSTPAAAAGDSAPLISAKPAKPDHSKGITFRVVVNDGQPDNLIDLIHLKNVFSVQLPKMPKEYIVRLVMDRGHRGFGIYHNKRIVGGICFRPFYSQQFAEIVFCAITSSEQVKGHGTRLMNHLKEHVKKEGINYFLTYADNHATGYFKKQGFSKIVSMPKAQWAGWIKDYDGGTLMECKLNHRVNYLDIPGMIKRQKLQVQEKIKEISNSHVVYPGLSCFAAPASLKQEGLAQEGVAAATAAAATTVKSIPIQDIPGVAAAGWQPSARTSNRSSAAELEGSIAGSPLADLCAKLGAVLKGLKMSKDAWPFEVPVDKKAVADYYACIAEPMDLKTMESKLNKYEYRTVDAFCRDVMLIVNNCRQYNTPDTTYYRCASAIETLFHSLAAQHQLVSSSATASATATTPGAAAGDAASASSSAAMQQ